jgi:hypothetical protein
VQAEELRDRVQDRGVQNGAERTDNGKRQILVDDREPFAEELFSWNSTAATTAEAYKRMLKQSTGSETES